MEESHQGEEERDRPAADIASPKLVKLLTLLESGEGDESVVRKQTQGAGWLTFSMSLTLRPVWSRL